MKKDSKIGVYITVAFLTIAGVYVGRSMANAGSDGSRADARLSIPDRMRSMQTPQAPRSPTVLNAQNMMRPRVNIQGNRSADSRTESAAPVITAPSQSEEVEQDARALLQEVNLLAQSDRRKRKAATSAARSHTIRPGERLWDIARKYYGSGAKWTRIQDANPGINPNNLELGTKLIIP